jgi:hypothetical protein
MNAHFVEIALHQIFDSAAAARRSGGALSRICPV